MKYFKSLAVCIIICSTACTSNSQPDEKISNNSKVETQKISPSCLSNFAEKACDVVSVEQIASIAGVKISAIEHEFLNPLNKLTKTFCNFEWNSGRTITAGTIKMQIPVDDEIKVGFFMSPEKDKVEGSYVDWFDNRYRTMTDEEMASFKKELEKKLKEEDEVVKEAARGLSSLPKGFRYERIENLGDRAAAENFGEMPDVTLYVLNKDTKFEVLVSASPDRDKNLEMAIQIARLVLAHCD